MMPLNVAYVIWVAIGSLGSLGSLGSVGYGIYYNNESKDKRKLFWVATMILGVLLLKSAS